MKTRRALCLWGTFAAAMLVAASAQALPSTQPDATYMVDGTVRAIVQVQPPGQDLIWLGGKFSHLMKTRVIPFASVDGLAVLDNVTGAPAPAVHTPILSRSTGDPTVFDMALSPDASVLYIAGQFNTVDGVARKNVAAIDPATGALLPFAPNAQAATSIFATDANVYVGGVKLTSYLLDGSRTPGFFAPKAIIDPSLRNLTTKAAFRSITTLGSTLVVACQCDSIQDGTGVYPSKAAAEIDAATGTLLAWTPSNMQTDSGAWGVEAILNNDPISGLPTVYLAAGGSDFTAAYDFATGTQIWKTDTSGSSQALTMYQGALIVGGHFLWTESPTTPQCGQNDNPTPGCYHTPRLVALDPATGDVLLSPDTAEPWSPGICCIYLGLWSLVTDANGTALHVGGAFKESGGVWTFNGTTGLWELHSFAKQMYYARFSDPPPPPTP
jgi:hypothetical protein